MLKMVSWGQYAEISAVLLGGYYLVIGWIFYRTPIRNLLSGNIKIRNKEEVSEESYAIDNDEEDRAFEELEAMVADLKRSVLDQAGHGAGKDQLLIQLKSRLANYDGLRRPAFQIAINDFIISNAKETCGVVFSEEELDAAWATLPR